MSACQQAKAKRRKMRDGYAHLGNSLKRPTVAGKSFRTVSDSIAQARQQAMAEQARKRKG